MWGYLLGGAALLANTALQNEALQETKRQNEVMRANMEKENARYDALLKQQEQGLKEVGESANFYDAPKKANQGSQNSEIPDLSLPMEKI